MPILDDAKLALRITGTAYEPEIMRLIEAAKMDLDRVGVDLMNAEAKPLVEQAILTYVRINFGSPSDYDKLKISYDEQLLKLKAAGKYRAEVI